MIKIWSDINYKTNDCHMLIPFWKETKDLSDPDYGRFQKWENKGKNIFQFVNSPKEADWIIYPTSPTINLNQFNNFQNQYTLFEKPIVVFFNNDSDIDINLNKNTWLFRTSFYKSKQKQQEFALPGWSKGNNNKIIFPWSNKPLISFCGALDDFNIRKQGINALNNHLNIQTSFIIRQQFWGGRFSNKNALQVRQEFLDNMLNSGYVLCARGGGNFSYRIYETMMNGRIPVLINTDSVLPYDFIINWSSQFPIINIENINIIGEKLYTFHQNLGPEKFLIKQQQMRDLWEEYLSPYGFFKNLWRHFEI